MQVPMHFPPFCSYFHRNKLLHFPNEKLTTLADSFSYVIPEVIKNTGHRNPVDIWLTGMIASTRIHKRNTSSLLSLFVAIITYILLCSYPPFSCRQPTLRKMPAPKSNFGVHTGTRFQLSRALHLTSRRPRFTPSSHRSGGFM